MRVALDVRALDDPALAERGIGRYVSSLRDALRAAAGRTDGLELVELRELRRPPAPARFAEAWEHLLLGRDLQRAHVQLVHSPSIDFVSARPGVPLVVTVHDLAPLKDPGHYLRSGLKHRLRYAAVKRAARVIAPSPAVADDCVRLLKLPRDRIAVIAEAPAPPFHPRADARERLARLGLPDRFILWVGGLDPPDPRKRVGELVGAVREAEIPLVLAGRVGDDARQLATPGRVQLAGRVDDDELASLYTLARALVVSSDEEGYGLPAIEALACGTPVVAFEGAADDVLRGQPGATLVRAGDFGALLAAAGAAQRGSVERPARTWTDVAQDTLAVYRDCLAP